MLQLVTTVAQGFYNLLKPIGSGGIDLDKVKVHRIPKEVFEIKAKPTRFTVDDLERFVMDTFDVIMEDPNEYELEGVKSTVAYRFELYRAYEKTLSRLKDKS